MLDWEGLFKVNEAAALVQNAINNGDWERATQLWTLTEVAVASYTDNVDFYNILYPHHPTTDSKNTRNASHYGVEEYLGNEALCLVTQLSWTTNEQGPYEIEKAKVITLIPTFQPYFFAAPLFDRHVAAFAADPLTELMNGQFKDYLGSIPETVIWGSQSGNVFDAMRGDFMKPVIDIG